MRMLLWQIPFVQPSVGDRGLALSLVGSCPDGGVIDVAEVDLLGQYQGGLVLYP